MFVSSSRSLEAGWWGSCGPSQGNVPRGGTGMPPDEASSSSSAPLTTACFDLGALRSRASITEHFCERDWNLEGFFEVHAQRGESSGGDLKMSFGSGVLSSRRFPMPVSATPQNFHMRLLFSPLPCKNWQRGIYGERRCAPSPLVVQFRDDLFFFLKEIQG